MKIMEISEFKTKGTFIIATQVFFEKQMSKDYFNLNWNKYYPDKVVVSSSWYQSEPIMRWLEDAAKDKNSTFRDLVMEHTKHMLERDLNGVYKFIMKLAGVRKILDAQPQLAKSYHNWLVITNLVNNGEYYQAEIKVPNLFYDFTICAAEGALKGVLSVCGQKMIDFRIISSETFIENSIHFSKIIYGFNYTGEKK